jgi:2'-5' RNA ligase
VSRDGSLRLFCALRLRPETVGRIADWQASALPGQRVVPPANLHLTLVFLGATPSDALGQIGDTLGALAARSGPIRLSLRGYRELRHAGMLVFDDEAGAAGALADGLADAFAELGLLARRERRPWLPHPTVLRFAAPPRLRPELPEFGPVSPSDTAVYSSVLRPDGARYEALEARPLGG